MNSLRSWFGGSKQPSSSRDSLLERVNSMHDEEYPKYDDDQGIFDNGTLADSRAKRSRSAGFDMDLRDSGAQYKRSRRSGSRSPPRSSSTAQSFTAYPYARSGDPDHEDEAYYSSDDGSDKQRTRDGPRRSPWPVTQDRFDDEGYGTQEDDWEEEEEEGSRSRPQSPSRPASSPRSQSRSRRQPSSFTDDDQSTRSDGRSRRQPLPRSDYEDAGADEEYSIAHGNRQRQSRPPTMYTRTKSHRPGVLSQLLDDLGYDTDDDTHRNTRGNAQSSAPAAHDSSDSYEPTSNLSNYTDGVYPDRRAQATQWDSHNQVSAEDTRSYAGRHSGDRSSAPMHSTSQGKGPLRSSLRIPDPSSKNIEHPYVRMADWKHDPGHRVAFSVNRKENYWKTHDLPEGEEDEDNRGFAAHDVPSLERSMEAQAENIFKSAGINHAPTTNFTMEKEFKIMHKLDLTGSELNPDSALIREACDLERLTADERSQLRSELEKFGGKGFTHINDLHSIGCDMIHSRGAVPFWKTDQHTRKEAYGTMLKAWVDGRTIIFDKVQDRRRWLDEGNKIDVDTDYKGKVQLEASDPMDTRTYENDDWTVKTDVTYEATEAKREKCIAQYNKLWDQYKDFDTEAGGKAPRPVYTAWGDQCIRFKQGVEEQKDTEQQERAKSKIDFIKYLAQRKENPITDEATLRSELSTFETRYNVRRENKAYKRLLGSLNADSYLTRSEWAATYPELAESKTWSEAVAKSTDDPEYQRRWWRAKSIAKKLGHTETYSKNPVTLTGSLQDKFTTMTTNAQLYDLESGQGQQWAEALKKMEARREKNQEKMADKLEKLTEKIATGGSTKRRKSKASSADSGNDRSSAGSSSGESSSASSSSSKGKKPSRKSKSRSQSDSRSGSSSGSGSRSTDSSGSGE